MSDPAFDYELYESYFAYRQITPNTWCFNTNFQSTPVSSDAYLLIGDKNAIMIDCGMSKMNLKAYIDQLELTDKPILGVIDTHSHFDHTASNGYFGHAFMHPNSEFGAKNAAPETLKDYPMDYGITFVREGDTIDLGGRVLEILEIPAHDPGSIAILDRQQRLLFTGDECESSWMRLNLQCKDTYPGQSIEKHIANMRRLKDLSGAFDRVCPSHHGNPVDKQILDQFITCGTMLLEKIRKEYGEIREEYYKTYDLPLKQRPQILCRYRSAHMGYFLGYTADGKQDNI